MSLIPNDVSAHLVDRPLQALFADDPDRAERYVVDAGDLRIDYSKHPIDDDLLAALIGWATTADVPSRR
ncbi:MAG: glucose-6-phosphate isomerase, partial [Ilumatobacter sp.]|nr:glucose-6-phosphate isomerase [Ilumatobacter sp.]